MEKEYGREAWETVINTKVNTKMIKNGVKEALHGLQEIFSKATMKLIKGMDMDKCIGRMVATIKVSG